MDATDQLLAQNEEYAEAFDHGQLGAPPTLRVAIVTCMDARLDPARALGLRPGDAHVIRNAGGVVTDDVIRSLAISQHELGTEEVVLILHTRCGMQTFTDEQFASKLEQASGRRPPWSAGAFADIEDEVRESVRRVRESEFLPRTDRVRGFVYDVGNGRVTEVT